MKRLPTSRRAWLALPLAALLAACATRLPPVATATSAERFTGRLAMSVAGSERHLPQSVNAAFELRGGPRAGEIELASALGTLLAQARWSAGEVLLVTPQGTRRFDDLDQLSREALGESLPLAALFDWLRGRPWPGAASSRLASSERLGFEQLGWEVDLSSFDGGVIAAVRKTAPEVQLRVKLER